MTKEAETKIAPIAQKVFDLRAQKAQIEADLKAYEQQLKDEFTKIGTAADRAGDYFCEIQKVAPSKIVDTVKLKAAGLFEQYSKDKAGYDKLLVKKVA
jgi:hypothetical protein